MSRISKWKLEKTKVKVVFRLQFHATHIPQSGWDKLFISFLPSDSGKATAKTTKANVRNGSCKWADPIYETTRLLQDAKSKQYNEKLYRLVVAMGSSRSSILGEATINLADYANALKPSFVSMPLHGCNSGTVLHVTIQLLTSKTGFREFEQQREVRERGLQLSGESKLGDGSPGNDIATDQVEEVYPCHHIQYSWPSLILLYVIFTANQFMLDVSSVACRTISYFRIKYEACCADKLMLSNLTLEAEEKHGQPGNQVSVDLALLEVELQKLTSDISEELGMSNSIIAELTQEKQWILVSLQDKIQESIMLTSEHNRLVENLRSISDALEVERTIKEKLEGTVRDLQEKLIEYEMSDQETEKSRLNFLPLQHDECLEKLQDKSSCITLLQTQLAEMDECVLAADVELTFLLNAYGNLQHEFAQHIKLSDACYEQLQKRHLEVEAMLNHCLVHEAHYRAENAKFSDANNVVEVQLEE